MPGDLIQTPQTKWLLGNYESVHSPNPIVLLGRTVQNAGNDSWTTLRQQFTAAGYKVPTGKTLYITDAYFWSDLAIGFFHILYGDTDVGINSAAQPVNPIYYGAASLTTSSGFVINTAYQGYQEALHLKVPSEKYLAIVGNKPLAAFNVRLVGHEE